MSTVQFFQQFQELKLKSANFMIVSPASFFHFHLPIYYPFRILLKLDMVYPAYYVVIISCIILVGIFSIQHHGTHRVAFLFAPVVAAWLLCISSIGIYNIYHWNPKIYLALSPVYILRFIKATGIEGWLSLGGVVLSITGTYTTVKLFREKLQFRP